MKIQPFPSHIKAIVNLLLIHKGAVPLGETIAEAANKALTESYFVFWVLQQKYENVGILKPLLCTGHLRQQGIFFIKLYLLRHNLWVRWKLSFTKEREKEIFFFLVFNILFSTFLFKWRLADLKLLSMALINIYWTFQIKLEFLF